MEDVFRLALSGTEKVVHSSSTMRCGAFDDDDFFIYMGGLAAAVRSILALAPRGRPAAGRAAFGIELDPGRPGCPHEFQSFGVPCWRRESR